MRAITTIQTAEQLAKLVDTATAGGFVAIDTEFLRERTYSPILCLIQIQGDGFAACIDPLAIDDLSPLGELLANDAVVKIFHSCRQDLEAFDTRTETRAANLYDTQLAAAFCGYGGQASYAALVETMCAVHLPKSHTRTDWSRRPLSAAQLQYAMDDVKYLPDLREKLDARLCELGRVEWHREECEAAIDPRHYQFNPDDAWQKLKGADGMNARMRAAAKGLAAWREKKARHSNRPRTWILSNQALLQICRDRPKTAAQLADIDNITPGIVRHSGRQILAAIAAANAFYDTRTDDTARPKNLTPAQRKRVGEIMQWLDQRATDAGINRALITNRREVVNFVRGDKDLPLFNGWRGEVAGKDILAMG